MTSGPPSTPTPPRALPLVLVAVSLIVALGFAPLEWLFHYRPRVSNAPLPAWDQVVLVLAIARKSLLAFCPTLLVAGLLSLRSPSLALRAGVGLLSLTAVALAVDFRTAQMLGNPLTHYLGRLGDPESLQWAALTSELAWPALETVLVAGGCVAVVAWSALRLSRDARVQQRLPAERVQWIGSLAALGVALALPSVLTPSMSQPVLPARLAARLPMSTNLGGAGESPALLRVDRMLTDEFGRYAPLLDRAQPVEDPVLPPTAPKPDVVVIVLESFRSDSLDPRWMPRVARWAEGGLRGERHYAGSNASQLGLYSLLYGRSPLSYVAVLRDRVPAQLNHTLRASGYRTHLLTSTRVEWHRMDVYLSPLNFDAQRLDVDGDWFERDRRSLAALRETLEAEERPVLALAFLMSTHFDYRHPPEYASRHTPAAARGQPWVGFVSQGEPRAEAVPLVLNRYRNTLAFMDDLLGEFLESLDPRRTLVVLTGDHGESFLEDGDWLHSSRLSDQQCGVPFALVGAGVPARSLDTLSSHVDVVPTLLARLGLPQPLRHTHGRDLLGESSPSPVLLTDTSLQQTVLVKEEGRLAVGIAANRARAQALGFLNAKADWVSEPDTLSPEAWAEAYRGGLERITR